MAVQLLRSARSRRMFGLDNTYKAYGEDIHLTSPALDLSADKGNFTVRPQHLRRQRTTSSVSPAVTKPLTHILAEQGAQSLSLQFDNGTPSTTIRIESRRRWSIQNAFLRRYLY